MSSETLSAQKLKNKKQMKASHRRTQMPVSEFISLYDNPKTKYNYLLAVTNFLKFIYEDEEITTQNKKQLNSYAKDYLKTLKKERDLFYDLKLTANAYAKKYAPKTARLNLTITIIWLEDNGHKLSRRDRKRIFATLPAPQAVRKDPELTAELFAKIKKHLPLWAKTMLVVLTGSGIRIGEALKLKKTDLNKTGKRTTATIKAENSKTKTERTVYLTNEAEESLRKYLAERNDTDDRLFPYSAAQAQYTLRKAKTKASADFFGEKNIMLFHWHVTRKWFLSRFNLSASKSVGEMLAGHAGYLDNAYRRYSSDVVADEFIKAEPFIEITG
ncbi:MAG: site-specific integrase [Methanocorpusculum sp.]|nr:site-specific integrase [Methanocorpusculum sp.]